MEKIFISYAREDFQYAKRLYDDLRRAGMTPWLDREQLLAGENWSLGIQRAMESSDYVVILMSKNSLSKRGFVQNEVREALKLLKSFPPDSIFVIPARLEDCLPLQEELRSLSWADLFPSYEEGVSRILRSISLSSESVGSLSRIRPSYRLDASGFPLIWVEEISAFLGWLPITKVQVEHHLAQSDKIPGEWYENLLRVNPRVAPDQINRTNYWRSFATGILPNETEAITSSSSLSEGWRLPWLDEWFTAFGSLKRRQAIELDDLPFLENLRPRVRMIVEKLDTVSRSIAVELQRSRSLADQMMMRFGVMEWVRLKKRNQEWGGMGELVPGFAGLLFRPDFGQPALPRDPNQNRVSYFGSRVIVED